MTATFDDANPVIKKHGKRPPSSRESCLHKLSLVTRRVNRLVTVWINSRKHDGLLWPVCAGLSALACLGPACLSLEIISLYSIIGLTVTVRLSVRG